MCRVDQALQEEQVRLVQLELQVCLEDLGRLVLQGRPARKDLQARQDFQVGQDRWGRPV